MTVDEIRKNAFAMFGEAITYDIVYKKSDVKIRSVSALLYIAFSMFLCFEYLDIYNVFCEDLDKLINDDFLQKLADKYDEYVWDIPDALHAMYIIHYLPSVYNAQELNQQAIALWIHLFGMEPISYNGDFNWKEFEGKPFYLYGAISKQNCGFVVYTKPQ